ncbi:MAG: 30S ribosomal protein S9 [Deltaproteobacteria bacterium]|nr:30S ribosomal protein S9 [Deltaproteobacteria bacterium]MBW2366300.1 30S ribosomal protein S9 [Deltaproteobacteria bacterium]
MTRENTYYATGRRKSSTAKTWLTPGRGDIMINGRSMDNYFSTETAKIVLTQPLVLTNTRDSFDIRVSVCGGGLTGQAGAIRHGITRALLLVDPDLRKQLKRAGFVRRDPRAKERKKYGQRSARARFQFSKR